MLIKEFIGRAPHVYFYMRDKATCLRFYRDAEKEGISFGGKRPTKKAWSDLIALCADERICYVGFAGRILYQSGDDAQVLRIDYAAFADGEKRFIL